MEKCQYFLNKEYGACNLVETIRGSLVRQTKLQNVIFIRRIENDNLFPYDSETFIRWWHSSPVDPMTMEDLSYISDVISLKEHECMYMPNVNIQEVTQEFRKQLLEKYIKENLPGKNLQFLTQCRSLIDVATLKHCNYIHHMDFDECKTYLESHESRAWLIRKSSVHKIMPNSECIVFAINDDGVIKQFRWLHVFGVGWYLCRGDSGRYMNTFKNFYEAIGQKNPRYVCLVDIIHGMCHDKKLDFAQIILSN